MLLKIQLRWVGRKTYQKPYNTEYCPLVIVTKGHLEKDTKDTLKKGPSPLATWITDSGPHQQPIKRWANMEDKRRRVNRDPSYITIE